MPLKFRLSQIAIGDRFGDSVGSIARSIGGTMSDWFRNTDWNADIEAGFTAKLARSRGQKAQYLRIQGSNLKDTHPRVAIELLRQCVALGDAFFVAPALLDMGHAYYRLGDLSEALDCLQAAIAQEIREPLVRTSAAYDYAMLVALHARADRYDTALSVLESAAPVLPIMAYQREAARAIILDSLGDAAKAEAAARKARALEGEQGWIPGHPIIGSVPSHDNPLGIRIEKILTRGTSSKA